MAQPGWQLVINVNPADNHNFGAIAEWADRVAVGSEDAALSADYINVSSWGTDFQFIAIVRHQLGICEAVKIWEYNETLNRSLLEHFLESEGEMHVVSNNASGHMEFVPENLTGRAEDPIFGADGDLVLNWRCWNSSVRIAIDAGLGLLDCNASNETLWAPQGLGVDFDTAAGTGAQGRGSVEWWHDASLVVGPCIEAECQAQGFDRGSAFLPGPVLGQYAIFTATDVVDFNCSGTIVSAVDAWSFAEGLGWGVPIA